MLNFGLNIYSRTVRNTYGVVIIKNMLGKVRGKRLSESQRFDIMEKLNKPNPPSKRAIARTYNVSNTTIRKIWNNRDSVVSRTSHMSSGERNTCYRASEAKFPELEQRLYEWVDMVHRIKLVVPPSLGITKAKKIALNFNIQ